ncbi:TetR/AcrR family transcriptional regulator [Cryptosporangium arvum]|uniref:TetR/AcrR family transcriptional regulator n=1 Tax=Cryptosporangium arvum TaxID=80871 RepID=UPI0004B624F9|nr:TetR family transcriptional regulator [Cryptosporangium arvum]
MSLRERKRQQARERIVGAAYDLFAERGFDAVTVADIAARAEVGRTTFFRYFGDKQEVVFADEQRHADRLGAVRESTDGDATTLPAAMVLVRAIVLAISEEVVADPVRYAAHDRLVNRHPELRDRMHRKHDHLTGVLEETLAARGADPGMAALAARLGIACFEAARRTAAGDAAALSAALLHNFDTLDELGSAPVSAEPVVSRARR